MSESKFYRVAFREPVGSHDSYYFGSLSAIYETFTAEQIGCKVERLWAVNVCPGHPYVGSRCTVSQEVLYRKKTKRGKLK
jgi:hypothetical protein